MLTTPSALLDYKIVNVSVPVWYWGKYLNPRWKFIFHKAFWFDCNRQCLDLFNHRSSFGPVLAHCHMNTGFSTVIENVNMKVWPVSAITWRNDNLILTPTRCRDVVLIKAIRLNRLVSATYSHCFVWLNIVDQIGETKTEMSHWLSCHWLHRQLPFSQLPVQPLVEMSSKWHSRFGFVDCNRYKIKIYLILSRPWRSVSVNWWCCGITSATCPWSPTWTTARRRWRTPCWARLGSSRRARLGTSATPIIPRWSRNAGLPSSPRELR